MSELKYSKEQIIDACKEAGLGILECNSLITVLGCCQPEATKPAQDLSAAIDWLRNNYQDHTNIASLCDAMCAALASPADAPNDSIRGPLRDADRQHCMSYAATLGVNRETAEAIINTTASRAYVNGFQDGKPEPADAPVTGDSETTKDTERLDFVLENGVPMMRNGEYRFHGFPGKWFKTDREAIDFAIQAQKDGHGSNA